MQSWSAARGFKIGVLAVVLAVGAAGCSGGVGGAGPAGPTGASGTGGPNGDQGSAGTTGADGTNGTNGTNGAPGTNGTNGASTGSITGTLTYQPGSTVSAVPATNVTVAVITITDSVVSTVTDAAGAYLLANIPAGVHSLKFSGNAFATLQVDGVSVVATKIATVSRPLVPTNPITLTPPAATAPAGFNAPATLGVSVTGGTAPYTYTWAPATSNPTAVTLSSTTAAAPTFTTGTLAAVIASNKAVGFGQVTGFDSLTGALAPTPNKQIGFLPLTAQQLAQMTYNFTVTVTDAVGFTKSATVAIPPATLAQGSSLVPLNQLVIANLPTNTAATLAVPSGSAATLRDAGTANPWFIPDAKGVYTVSSGTSAVAVTASSFISSNKDCGVCHAARPVAIQANVASKFKDWANSAHGNHFFKYMHYEGEALVWNADASGKPIPAPTANPTVFWDQPGAMTTYQFGLTGAEGTHYSASCTSCHTTGYNALAKNGGMDDAQGTAGWAFPNLTSILGTLTGATSAQQVVNGSIVTMAYDQVTAAPNAAAWTAMPAAVKAFAGMQCESCHGPLGAHDGTGAGKPVPEMNTASCAVCHDKPSNHDRVALWRQSKHANLATALAEGAGVSTTGGAAAPRASCNRCHSAQGFVQYVNQLTGALKKTDGTAIAGNYPGNLIDPATSPLADASVGYLQGIGITADKVQPITCQACHDPHTTQLRLEGSTPMLPSGFKVAGAGSGAICFVCHNSRNGARGDQLNGVYTNNDNPGTPAPVTSIGGPHEANQGDVLLGKNAFFVGSYKPSAHMAVKDTCVGCHMKTFPAGMTGTNTNHTWNVDSTSCATCHGGSKDPVDGEALQGQFDLAVADLQASLDNVGLSVRGAYFKGSKQTVQIPADATAVFVTGRSPGFVLGFPTPMSDPNNTAGTVAFLGTIASPAGLTGFYTDAGASTRQFDVLKGTVAKANWNFALLTQDGSRGVHNPSFAFDVISATASALNGPAPR